MSDSRPQSCTNCKKPASIHLSQVIDGKVKKFALCEDCPAAVSILKDKSFDLIGHLGKTPSVPTVAVDRGDCCPHCGFSQEDFKQRGRLGCSRCYDVFADKLEPILAKVQRDTTHRGKGTEDVGSLEELPEVLDLPVSSDPEPVVEIDPVVEVAGLKKRMEELVNLEEYEQAAEIRDKIKALEESVGS